MHPGAAAVVRCRSPTHPPHPPSPTPLPHPPPPRHTHSSYVAPPLPPAAYTLGLQAPRHQRVAAEQAARITARWLSNSSPPLVQPVVLPLLDFDRDSFSMSRLLVNWRRIQLVLLLLQRVNNRRKELQWWRRPRQSAATLAALLCACYCPRVAVPPLLGCAVWAACSADVPHSGLPAAMELDPPGIPSEHEELHTTTSNPYTLLKRQVARLQAVALNIQRLLEAVAGVLERGWVSSATSRAAMLWLPTHASACMPRPPPNRRPC